MIDKQRVIECCKLLVSSGYAKSLAEIAVKCGKSKQYFSDLKGKDFVNVTPQFVDELCDNYPVNKEHILIGNGDPMTDGDMKELGDVQEIGKALVCAIKKSQEQISKSQEQIDRLLSLLEIEKKGKGTRIA